MSLQALVQKYIQNTEKVVNEIQLKQGVATPNQGKIIEVIEYAKRYLSDAKHYQEKKQFETALASVAYCEGILDALRLLDMVGFTWPNTKEKA